MKRKEHTWQIATKDITSIVTGFNKHTILISSLDGTLGLWSLKNHSFVFKVNRNNKAIRGAVCLTPRHLIAIRKDISVHKHSYQSLKILSVHNGSVKIICEERILSSTIWGIAVRHRGEWLFAPKGKKQIGLWTFDHTNHTIVNIRNFTIPAGYIKSFAVTSNGNVVAVASTERLIFLFNSKNGHIIGNPIKYKGDAYRMKFFNNQYLFKVGYFGIISEWNCKTQKKIAKVSLEQGAISCIAVAPSTHQVYVGNYIWKYSKHNDSINKKVSVQLWNVKSKKLIHKWSVPPSALMIRSIMYLKSTDTLIAGDSRGYLHIWHMSQKSKGSRVD